MRDAAFFVAHGVDRRQEDVIHLLFDELHHVAVNQLHRVAGFALRRQLGKAECLLARRVGQHDIESQRAEKCVRHREELMNHQHIRHADGLFVWVNLARVALQQQLVGLLIKRDVACDFGVLSVIRRRGVRCVEARKVAFAVADGLQRQHSCAECAADGKARADLHALAVSRLERRDNAGVVIYAAL